MVVMHVGGKRSWIAEIMLSDANYCVFRRPPVQILFVVADQGVLSHR